MRAQLVKKVLSVLVLQCDREVAHFTKQVRLRPGERGGRRGKEGEEGEEREGGGRRGKEGKGGGKRGGGGRRGKGGREGKIKEGWQDTEALKVKRV